MGNCREENLIGCFVAVHVFAEYRKLGATCTRLGLHILSVVMNLGDHD